MTDLNNVEINTLQPSNFTVLFDKLPGVEFHLKQVPLPNITLAAAELGTMCVVLNVPSEIVTYDPFTLMFSVDEKCDNWDSIHDWMLEFRNENLDWETMLSNATVLIKDGDLDVVKEYKYESCFPITLSEVTLSYSDDQPGYDASATFKYDKFYKV